MFVCKFGGSSLADAAQFRKVRAIIEADSRRRLLVVSAPGKGNRYPWKVTDQLITIAESILAHEAVEQQQAALFRRYEEICRELALPLQLLQELQNTFTAALFSAQSPSERYVARLKAFGEESSARLLAAFLERSGISARFLSPSEAGLLLEGSAAAARVAPASYDLIPQRLQDFQQVLVIPGFYAHNAAGELLTFSRGGSDVSASVFAAALRAEVYENWTDIPSVYSFDPRLSGEAKALPHLQADDMQALAALGSQVLHPAALSALYSHGQECVLNIRNTNAPEQEGTLVDTHCPKSDELLALAGKAGQVGLRLATDFPLPELLRQNILSAPYAYLFVKEAGEHWLYFDQQELSPSEQAALRKALEPAVLEERQGLALLGLLGPYRSEDETAIQACLTDNAIPYRHLLYADGVYRLIISEEQLRSSLLALFACFKERLSA